MSTVVALDRLFNERRLWRGQATPAAPASRYPSGHATLDAVLPGGGWPEAALSELLVSLPGVGELSLLLPTLARLSQAGERIVLVGPPHLPYPPAWQAAGVDLGQLSLVQTQGRDALWAAEQCLRSGSCGAVLTWPDRADDRALRRLQVAAESGQTLAFAYRSLGEARNPSPAALRLAIEANPARLRVIKCRGGQPSARPIPLDARVGP
ncbi:CDP-6-deoxy-delta-3,4-glucoseen reductase [Pseudomonas sp. 1D4]|uniref:translesion DNA synthesis-associated protein ImuA n=1 Tax=Pseudomonadaceae TaxID=135621 RepID=UPI00084B34C1|nr:MULTISPECIES: translesion DNA synthesis-associated protein ImuA [Pseudomonas]OEC43638.1 CDP-6-deoxy-delta-3,4-glucoseen reductase [Pseudomonas sp. 1D4]OEC59075.1 CDP-6-deoxy-delta-3,4-glucoseen reductase [Pseudomonas sp. ENNP23]